MPKGVYVRTLNMLTGKKHHSEKTRRKISLAGLGRPSPMKGKHTGKPAWNRGISPSEGTRKKMSLAKKGKAPWNKNKPGSCPHSDEWKQKVSAARTGHPVSLETRAKLSASRQIFLLKNPSWNVGHTVSEETRRKISLANIGRTGKITSGSFKIGATPWNKGIPCSEETRRRFSRGGLWSE